MIDIFAGTKNLPKQNVRKTTIYKGIKDPIFMKKKGMLKTSSALIKSQTNIVLLLSHLSTYTPAMGPIKNTGIIVSAISLASSKVEPGALLKIKAIKAI
jgi:hypothetical protein